MLKKSHLFRLTRIGLISFFDALFSSIPYLILLMVINNIVDKELTIETFTIYTIVIIVSGILRTIFSYLNVTTSRNDGNLIIKDLRLELGEHIRKLPLGFFSTHDIGELSNKTLDHVNKVEIILTMILPGMVSTFGLSILISGLLFYIHPPMAIATLISMPFVFLVLTWARQIMAKQGKALYNSSNTLSNSLLEFVNGIKHIKAYNNSSKKISDLINHMDDFKTKSLKTEGRLSPVMVLANITIDFGLVLIILIGSYLLVGESLDIKAFFAFIIIGSRFFDGLKTLSTNYVKLKYLGIARKSIEDIFQEPTLKGTDEIKKISSCNIEFKDVDFSYNEAKVLKKVSANIKECTLVALVGPSGSGKTTMTNVLARFFDIDSGQITIGGQDISTIDPEYVLSHMSMVFQKVMLFNDSIYNNIKIGKHNATEEEIIDAAKKAMAHDFIMDLPEGYETIVGDNGSNLSGGELQRLSIARAILKDAPIVLLDEATASLDPENELHIQKAINNMVENKTVIVIAHRLKTIKNADQILVFENGCICERGTHQELISNKQLYEQLWSKQHSYSGWQMQN